MNQSYWTSLISTLTLVLSHSIVWYAEHPDRHTEYFVIAFSSLIVFELMLGVAFWVIAD